MNANRTKTDVWTRRESDGKETTWIGEELLKALLDVSEDYLRTKGRHRYISTVPAKQQQKDILPDTGASWRFARRGGQFYYDYDRIPAQRRAALPPKQQLLQGLGETLRERAQADLETMVKTAIEAEFREYMHLYAGYSDRHCTALARACAVLMALTRHVVSTGANTRKNFFFQNASAVVERLGVQYLPANYRRLKDKVLAVAEGKKVDEVIDLPRAGNTNALRLGDAEIVSWMIQLRLHPANYTNAWIIRKIRTVCLLAGKATPSESWFEQKFAEHHNKWLTYARFGSGRQANALLGYVPVENAVFAGDCWQADGTRVNFIPYRDEDGKEKFLYTIVIVDVYSGLPVGWHFDTVENRWGYVEALKMACNSCGHLPYELVMDRFPGHNTEEWRLIQARIEKEGTKVTVTSKKTGKAKVERMFGTIQTVFMQDSPYYYGEGIQSRRTYAHRAPEYIKAIKQQAARDGGWNYEEACREATRIFELYRSTAYSQYSRRFKDIEQSPKELYAKSDKPHVFTVEPWSYVQIFGLEKQATILNAGIIKTEINRAEYIYHVRDYDVIAKHRKVVMCYDLEDLSTVHLFENSKDVNRKYLGEAGETKAVQLYGPDAKMNGLGKAKARIKDVHERRKQEIEELIAQGSEVELLLGLHSHKPATAAAETAWLEEMTTDAKPAKIVRQLPIHDDDDGEVFLDVRSMY